MTPSSMAVFQLNTLFRWLSIRLPSRMPSLLSAYRIRGCTSACKILQPVDELRCAAGAQLSPKAVEPPTCASWQARMHQVRASMGMPMWPSSTSSTFNSLHRVLFTIRSLYLCAIGPAIVFSLTWETPGDRSSCNPKKLYS